MDKVETIAASGATKICGLDKCYCSYECGHANRTARLPLMGTETVCPLAKYNVEPDKDPRPWYARPASETQVTQEEIAALCEKCEHAAVVMENGTEILRRVDFETACLDCPVLGVEEVLEEGAAEARMS